MGNHPDIFHDKDNLLTRTLMLLNIPGDSQDHFCSSSNNRHICIQLHFHTLIDQDEVHRLDNSSIYEGSLSTHLDIQLDKDTF